MSAKKDNRKKRPQIPVVLLFGEGDRERDFLSHIKTLYHQRNSGFKVKIKYGKGKTPIDVVRKALNVRGDFSIRVVVCDNDKGEVLKNEAQTQADKQSVIVLWSTPCLEATLLSILKNGKSFEHQACDWCKDRVQKVKKDIKSDADFFQQHFSKLVLEKQRKKIDILEKIISYTQFPLTQ